MSKGVVQITLFDGVNFFKWSENLKLALLESGHWSYVVNPSAEGPKLNEAKSNQHDVDKFFLKRDAALAKVLYSLGTFKSGFDNLKTPHEVYNEVQKRYQPAKATTIININTELFNLKLKEGGNLAAHIAQYSDIQARLTTLGKPIPDEIITAQLLSSLPHSFDIAVAALKAQKRGDDPLTFHEVMAYLIEEYGKSRPLPPTNPSITMEGEVQQALTVNVGGKNHRYVLQKKRRPGKPRNGRDKRAPYPKQNPDKPSDKDRGNDDQDTRRPWCEHCKRPGHLVDKCWVKNPRLKPKDNQQRGLLTSTLPTSNGGGVYRDNPSIALIASYLTPGEQKRLDPNKWILDSGATAHLTNNRHLYSPR